MTHPPKTIVYAAAEATPLAKAGGLGDIMGSLPPAMAALGYKVILFLPRYGFIDPIQAGFRRYRGEFVVNTDNRTERVSLWQGHLPQSTLVDVYLVEDLQYFGRRKTIYPSGDMDTEVNSFGFFSEAVLQLLHQMALNPDVIHINDWHTAPIARKLAERRQHVADFAQTKTVLTIHNLAYQGDWNGVNRLAEGLHYADFVTTVSPTYAQEIQTPEGGCGLDGQLSALAQQGKLAGILNGLDTHFYDPATDPALPARFSVETVATAKAYCKTALQQELGLAQNAKTPLFAVVSRLVEQKGFDILLPVLETLLPQRHTQWVILGSGDPAFEERCQHLGEQHDNLFVHIGFDESFSRHVYGGADFLVMPSRFEPCGLGQLIAMRYGTIPVVRATGGLKDTVIDITRHPQTGTGFWFNHYTPEDLQQGINTALQHYHQPSVPWLSSVTRAMNASFSWHDSAAAYDAVYNKLMGNNASPSALSVFVNGN